MIIEEKIKNSGFRPVIFPEKSKLCVFICELGESKTKSGLILTSETNEQKAYRQTSGILIDVIHASKEDEKIFTAQIGDKLSFRPYAGIHKEGNNGCAYRLLEGHEVHSIETE